MASVVVYIKKDYLDKNGESNVIMQYDHLYKRWRFNTGLKADPEKIDCAYDEDTELWKLTSTRQLKPADRKKLTETNEALRDIHLRITRVILELKSKNLSLSPDNVKLEFNKDPKARIQKSNKTVNDWYSDFIAAKEKEIGEGINSYRSTFEHFKVFTAAKGIIHFQHLTKDFLEQFRDHLDKLELGGPTVHKQFKNLRIFLNWVSAQDENDEIKIPTAYKKFKVKARYGDPIGLSVDQFFEFYNKDLSNRKFLERTRDVFAFAVSIGGPRHGDLKRLADTLRKNGFKIKQNTISYFEGKTGNAHQEIVLNKIGLEILEKYNYVMPRVPTNQRMNTNLKTIAKLLEWDEIKYVPEYDNFGKLVQVNEIPLKEIFSTKFMRKTAATIDNMLGVPTKTSMKRTGHKTFAAYSRYVDVNKDSLEQANKQWDDLAKKRTKDSPPDLAIAS
jgi:site-specific recombinase XerC